MLQLALYIMCLIYLHSVALRIQCMIPKQARMDYTPVYLKDCTPCTCTKENACVMTLPQVSSPITDVMLVRYNCSASTNNYVMFCVVV